MNLWLARMRLDLRDRHVRNDLADVVRLHQRVMSLFPDGLGERARQKAGVLFRLDELPGNVVTLLVQSRLEPNPDKLPPGYKNFQTRKLTPLLDALSPGMTVFYRLVGNPVKRLLKDQGHHRARQIVALSGAAADEWWRRRAEAAGLAPISARSVRLDTRLGTKTKDEKSHTVRHAATRFDGVAIVKDVDAAREAVINGIGKGKSYGCGLLSLAPARQR